MNNAKTYQVGTKGGNRFPLSRVVVMFSVLILLLNVVVVVKRGVDSREAALEEGKISLDRLTQTISEHIKLTFSAVDVTLKRASERQYFNALFGNHLIRDMHNHFIEWGKETPQLSVVLMTDETGEIKVIHRKAGYQTWLQDRASVADEPFFSQHSQSDDPDFLYVGGYDNWIKGSDGFIVMSRRLNKLDGNFGGIVLVAVSRAYVTNFSRSIEDTTLAHMVLTHADKTTLISEVERDDDRRAFIRFREQFSGHANVVETQMMGQEETDTRVFSSIQIPNLHMTVTVFSDVYGLLKTWRKEHTGDLIFLGVFALFVVVISFFVTAVTKQMQRVQRSEQAAVLASQAKSDFLANMSHELRTPLNAIIGFSEMIGQGYFGKLNDRQEERVSDINSCGTHLLSLINDILEFSKGEAGKITLTNEVLDIREVAGEVERMMADRAMQDKVTLSVQVDNAVPRLTADRRKLKQVLLNLVTNALKFTDEGGTVEVQAALTADKAIMLTVTDTGAGMKEADIPKALSAFGQVHDDPAKGGTGLGLPLCKLFTELHGGKLVLQSVENIGTRVTITLPAERIYVENPSEIDKQI